MMKAKTRAIAVEADLTLRVMEKPAGDGGRDRKSQAESKAGSLGFHPAPHLVPLSDMGNQLGKEVRMPGEKKVILI